MTKLRLVPYSELRKVAEASGFRWVRRKGSHNVFRNPEGRTVVIPDHGSQVILRPLLHAILRDLGITPDDYEKIIDSL